MRRTRYSGGWFVSLLLNLLLNCELGVLALVSWLLQMWLDWPAFPAWICLGAWLIYGILITSLVNWGASCGRIPPEKRKNINPYSVGNQKKTGDKRD